MKLLPTVERITTFPMATLLCWILSLSLSPLLMVATAFTTITTTRSIINKINNKLRPQEANKGNKCSLMSEASDGFKKFSTSDELRDAVRAYLENDFQDVSSVRSMYGDVIGSWDVSKISDFSHLFDYKETPGAEYFNEDISKWDVSKVSNMSWMFRDASLFNQDISKWDVSKVSNMRNMFYGASSFNHDISKWNVSSVSDMGYMFSDATLFNQDISKWDVSKVSDMRSMFHGACSFNQDISKWDVSSVRDMSNM